MRKSTTPPTALTNALLYSFEADNVVAIHAHTTTGPVLLGKISSDVSQNTLESFMADMVFKFEQTVFIKPRFTTEDLFLTSGAPRYLTLTGELNDWKWNLRLPGKVAKVCKYNGQIESDVTYFAQKIALYHGMEENSISFTVLKTAITALVHSKVLR